MQIPVEIPCSEQDHSNSAERSNSLMERLGRKTLNLRLGLARLVSDHEKIRSIHTDYWREISPERYYDRVTGRFELWFQSEHGVITDYLEDLCLRRRYDRLVEFGCGDGQVLNELASRLPGIESCIGVDVNYRIIERNRRKWAENGRMEFVEGDMMELLPLFHAPRTLFFCYGGVLEYLPQDHLQLLFSKLCARDCTFAFVEPVDRKHDFTSQTGSFPYGSERSFSHNHRALLEKTGWSVQVDRENEVAGIRWKMIVANCMSG